MPGASLFEDFLTQSLDTLQKLARSRRTVWGTPVPWFAEPIFAKGFVVAPDYGAANQLVILTYEVPRGYTALFCGVVFGYAGGATALPGQTVFTIDSLNANAAVTSPQPGYTVKDYSNVPFPLGSLVPGEPWPSEFKFDQNETVRIKGFTVASVPTGAGNFLFGALIGWQWPTMGWEG